MTRDEADEREAEVTAFLAVLHSIKELCEQRAPHEAIEGLVNINAKEFAERGIAFLTRLREAELALDAERVARFEDGRRAGLSQIYGMIQEAPKTWSAEQTLNEVVAAVKR